MKEFISLLSVFYETSITLNSIAIGFIPFATLVQYIIKDIKNTCISNNYF